MNLVETFTKSVARMIDEEGVYPQQGIIRTKESAFEMMALAMNAPEIFNVIHKKLEQGYVAEYIVGVDLIARDEDEDKRDRLVVLHVGEDFFKVGVMPYDYNNGDPIVEEIDWKHPFYSVNAHRYSFFAHKGFLAFEKEMSIK